MSLSARRAWIEMWPSNSLPMQGRVALRKESVDRNRLSNACMSEISRSLSARRAWIEMPRSDPAPRAQKVSLSARRAWIEINYCTPFLMAIIVALRKESVDRNDDRC